MGKEMIEYKMISKKKKKTYNVYKVYTARKKKENNRKKTNLEEKIRENIKNRIEHLTKIQRVRSRLKKEREAHQEFVNE